MKCRKCRKQADMKTVGRNRSMELQVKGINQQAGLELIRILGDCRTQNGNVGTSRERRASWTKQRN